MDFPEMGIQGEALVTSISPCPELESGSGRIVTGTYFHSAAAVVDLDLSNGESLGATPQHPFWSEDRHDWIAVSKLRPGETLLTLSGTVTVVSVTPREKPVPVYNLEVEGDHVYRVGQSGVLVHNASHPCSGFDLGESRAIEYQDRDVPNPLSWNRRGIEEIVKFRRIKTLVAFLQLYSGGEPDDYYKEMMWRVEPPSSLGPYPLIGVANTDSVGHIVGKQFGGYANRARGFGNVFPQDEDVNNGQFSGTENESAALLRQDGTNVCVVFKFTYPYRAGPTTLQLRPSQVKYIRYTINASTGESGNVETFTFDNPR